MNLLEHTSPQSILYFILYGGAATLCVVLCLYLLLSRVNVISPGTMPPVRLRRWAAAFYAAGALGHAWWFLLYLYFRDNQLVYGTDYSPGHVMGEVLDCVSLLITLAGTLLAMLQDRRRPVWPVAVASIPIAVLGVLQMAFPTRQFLVPALVYSLVAYVAFTVYMVFAIRQYGRWLLDNYADLEHKEVWLSLALLIGLMVLLMSFEYTDNYMMSTIAHLIGFPLAGLLLWRVETLPQLDETAEYEDDILPEAETISEPLPVSDALSHIGRLLGKHCEDTQLYLQPDLTLTQLSAAVGVNHYYLSQYFASQDTSYYAYIHDLRVRHFIARYRELAAAHKPIVAQQLAQESGYHSYSTFSTAFKQRMHKSVTAWMREEGLSIPSQ